MIGLQPNDILMLANNTFAIIEEEAIKTPNFMTKKQVSFLFQISIKFNSTWIQLIPYINITLSYET